MGIFYTYTRACAHTHTRVFPLIVRDQIQHFGKESYESTRVKMKGPIWRQILAPGTSKVSHCLFPLCGPSTCQETRWKKNRPSLTRCVILRDSTHRSTIQWDILPWGWRCRELRFLMQFQVPLLTRGHLGLKRKRNLRLFPKNINKGHKTGPWLHLSLPGKAFRLSL